MQSNQSTYISCHLLLLLLLRLLLISNERRRRKKERKVTIFDFALLKQLFGKRK